MNTHAFNPQQQLVVKAGFLLSLLLILYLKLLPALMGCLLVYGLVNLVVHWLPAKIWGRDASRLIAVTLVATLVIALLVLAGVRTGNWIRESSQHLPALIQRMAEIVESIRERLPPWLLAYLPDDADAIRLAIVDWLREHAGMFQMAGAGIGRGLAQLLIGMVVGALLSLESVLAHHRTAPLTNALSLRAQFLSRSFGRVVFAQLWISSINTLLTALFLAVVLPALGIELPFVKTLITVTFVAGLIPILGNLVSNTVIFIVSLSQSLWVALAALAYLVVIHKLEYFLNARIIGGQIRARAWELLIAMLVMEAAFGIAGLIAAPIYYAYLKDELRHRGWI